MGKIQLLDCTLRDGGYVNDWKFGNENLISIFERLVDAKADIIEIGFLDERRPYDMDRSIMPTANSVNKIFGSLDKKQSMVVVMIDYGTCGIENLQRCENCFLDGIRVIFKKHLMHEAMEFCKKVKELGYKVFSQLVSITSYSDEELLELIQLVNEVKPYAVSMVDTYGLLYPEDLLHYYQILDENVDSEIQIGFHAHNNFQLAYANVLSFLERKTDRNIVVDGTLFGMGKSAGNAPLELVGMRLNEKYRKSYDIDAMMEAIEEVVKNFYTKAPWGYKTFFYLCAKNKCHPNYVTYFEKKENLSITRVDELLATIEPEEKKLLYDQLLAEQKYQTYIEMSIPEKRSMEKFKNEIQDRTLLLIGPGKNVELQINKVNDFIRKKKPYVITINYIPEQINVDCIFLTNSRRYHEVAGKLKKLNVKSLATSNVQCRNGSFDYIVNRAPLLETDEKIIDNSLLMLIKLLQKIKVVEINCAGFDGYSDKEDNYCNPTMEYSFIKKEAAHLNEHMKKRIKEFRQKIKINFITFSSYDVEEDINGAAI